MRHLVSPTTAEIQEGSPMGKVPLISTLSLTLGTQGVGENRLWQTVLLPPYLHTQINLKDKDVERKPSDIYPWSPDSCSHTCVHVRLHAYMKCTHKAEGKWDSFPSELSSPLERIIPKTCSQGSSVGATVTQFASNSTKTMLASKTERKQN